MGYQIDKTPGPHLYRKKHLILFVKHLPWGFLKSWKRRLEVSREFGALEIRAVKFPVPPEAAPGRNTIIGVVAVDAVSIGLMFAPEK